MKNIFLAALIWITNLSLQAQERVSHYIFPDFTAGTIKFKTGPDVKAYLDYNCVTEEMIFKQQGKIQAISSENPIDTIYIQDRKFIPVDQKFYEVINSPKGILLVRHTATLIPDAVETGLGKTSNTALSNLSDIKMGVGTYNLDLPGYKVVRKDEYYIKNGNHFSKIKGM